MQKNQAGLAVMFLLILIPNTYGIGIAPARRIVEFIPLLEREFSGLLVNTAGEDVVVTLGTEDPLGILTLRNTTIRMNASDNEVRFSYTVRLPRNLPTNRTVAKIVAREKVGTGSIIPVLLVESVIEVHRSKDTEGSSALTSLVSAPLPPLPIVDVSTHTDQLPLPSPTEKSDASLSTLLSAAVKIGLITIVGLSGVIVAGLGFMQRKSSV